MSKLVIVESPSKAKTISRILGDDFEVIASNGHIRDLPKSKLGVDENLDPTYVVDKSKSKIIDTMKKSLKKSSKVFLASDPDREGEAISAHIANILNLDPKGKIRVEFNEITERAVSEAIENPREIDFNKFNAQQTRRILDRLVGYGISPLLWKRLGYGTSAGRVQSVALRMICELEDKIRKFVPEKYWSAKGQFDKIELLLNKYNDENAEKVKDKKIIESLEKLEKSSFKVIKEKITKKESTPPLPFKTSTLQQSSSSELGFSPSRTMSIAQSLYSGVEIKGKSIGLITYMRTDSTRISKEASYKTKRLIKSSFGEQYIGINKKASKDKSKVQDAHEAIRPTDISRSPNEVREFLSKDQFKVYSLIYNRFLASQMANMKYDQLDLSVERDGFIFKNLFNKKSFDGFTKVYPSKGEFVEKFPKFNKELTLNELEVEEKQTKPPAKFSEASLIKKLEAEGIGRPSTYASIVETLKSREYVLLEEKKFTPTNLGFAVKDILMANFSQIMDLKFTSDMENTLDKIEDGGENWKKVLEIFNKELEKSIDSYRAKLEEEKKRVIKSDVKCSECSSDMQLKRGRFGPYLECVNGHKVSVKDEDIDYDQEKNGYVELKDVIKESKKKKDGIKTDFLIEGELASLKEGPYGRYLEVEVEGKKIRKAIPKNIKITNKELNSSEIKLKERIEGEETRRQNIEDSAADCEKCGSKMKVKDGKWGIFLSCSAYPKCKNIRKIK